MKKVLSLLATVCVGGALFAATVQAQPVKFETGDFFGWGRLYDAAGSPTNLNPWKPATNNPGQSLAPLGIYKAGDGKEDSFGITRITKISDIPGTTTYWQASPTQELTAFFYGGDDVKLTDLGGGLSRLLVNNYTVDFWLEDLTLSGSKPYDTTAGTGGRTADDRYTSATEGKLVLKLEGHKLFEGPVKTNPYQVDEIGNALTGAFAGSVFADVVGGDPAWVKLYDSNTKLAPDGTFADFKYTFTTLPNVDPGKVADWVLRDVSHLEGAQVPEPGTLFLLGGGLLGLAAFARKRKAKK